MDWAVFDKNGNRLAGPYDDADSGDVLAERETERFPIEAQAWAAPVCPWHPDVPRENCPNYPHE